MSSAVEEGTAMSEKTSDNFVHILPPNGAS